MRANSDVTFVGMAREFPVRTALFTFGPPAFAVLQLVNGYFNGGHLPLLGVLVATMLAFAALTTRYHMAAYRLSLLRGPDNRGR